ncbi:hypothetical protein BSF40_52190 [Pseudomonas sp. ACN5]|nr:hypothetical protein BSF40_52190 [Pseudomonas sp. ACN5]
MALSVCTSFKGIFVKDAYVTVAVPSISTDKQHILFSAWYRPAQVGEVFRTESFETVYDLNGENPFVQAYEHLKTLPEFEGCLDC